MIGTKTVDKRSMVSEFENQAGFLRPEDKVPFQILIIYENEPALRHANKLQSSLARGCLNEVEIKSTAWTQECLQALSL